MAKYNALEVFTEGFVAEHGRKPTFWFDKCCIDQNAISDGLKVLPVNIVACKRVLVLCGPTYINRFVYM